MRHKHSNQPLSDSFTETSSVFVTIEIPFDCYVRPYSVKVIMFRLLFYEKYHVREIVSNIVMCFVFVSLSSHSDSKLCTAQ